MNRLVRPLAFLFGLPFVLASAWAVLSLAQDGGTPGSSESESAVAGEKSRGKDIFAETQKFTEILQYIRKMYFRPVDETVLIHGAIEGLLQIVDRNDSFVPEARTVLSAEDPEEAAAQGAGLVLGFTRLPGYSGSVPVVLSVLPGSPAERAGVRAESVLWQVGDRVVVSGEMLARNLYELLDRPPADKPVELVLYDPEDGRREVMLAPGPVQVPRELKVQELPSGIVQITLPTLVTDAAVDEVTRLLRQRRGDLERGLILDLREACLGDPKLGYALADLFVRDGAVLGKVLVQRGEKKLIPKRGSRGEELIFRARDGQAHLDFPLVALVDFTTAGPAEILAGALKHAGRAKVVGAKTFGYAALREPFVFERGIQITLTTGLFSTGMDKVYMGEGLEPDVKVERKETSELMAQAIETEAAAPEDEAAEPREAEAPAQDGAAPRQPGPDLLLESAEQEILKSTRPAKSESGKPEAVKPPSQKDKSGKEVG
jgi:carboxyl-terminal processing protease